MNVSAFINRVKESDHVGFPRKVKRYFTLKRLVEKKKFLAVQGEAQDLLCDIAEHMDGRDEILVGGYRIRLEGTWIGDWELQLIEEPDPSQLEIQFASLM